MNSPEIAALLPTLTADPEMRHEIRGRRHISHIALTLGAICLCGAGILISPPENAPGYPGVIPWRDGSPLKLLVDGISLGDILPTARGVEIKDTVFEWSVAAILALLAVRAIVSAVVPPDRGTAKGAWFLAQVAFVAWVAISAISSIWSPDSQLALGQTALYGIAVAWAIALAWCLDGRDAIRLAWCYVGVAAIVSVLCIWYYYERNRAHRPGFPIGNPSSLAAFILPAIAICGFVLFGAARELVGGGKSHWFGTILAALCLWPLGHCFVLANSRGSIAGLVVGFGGLAFLLARAKVRRWLVAGALLLAGASAGYLSNYSQDWTMGRGATIRFRVYAWQYAAQWWSHRPISGNGAASYPLLSGKLDAYMRDRALDPAAFMGEAVEHAHNELFEVFVEIGLIGGLTFVAAYVATLAAASGLLQTSLSAQRRWMLYGVVAGLIGQMADALFGVGLRLPGLSPAFFTMIGILWAMGRSVSIRRDATPPPEQSRPMILRRYAVAAMAGMAAIAAGILALQNTRGLRAEHACEIALGSRNYSAAIHNASIAERDLLDPVRRLAAVNSRVIARSSLAAELYQKLDHRALASTQPVSADLVECVNEAGLAASNAYQDGLALDARAPSFGRPLGLAARSAIFLASLTRLSDAKKSQDWLDRAASLLQRQRRLRPNDVPTLILLANFAKAGYTIRPEESVALLRDGLRSGPPPQDLPAWSDLLRREAARPDFRPAAAAMLAAIGPYRESSDLDALALSYAPEMHRLTAAILALDRDFKSAAAEAELAARLYGPLRPRFPALLAVTLGEKAEYLFRSCPATPLPAIECANAAIAAVPPIQTQRRQELIAPLARNLAKYQLAACDEPAASATLRLITSNEADVQALFVQLREELSTLAGSRAP